METYLDIEGLANYLCIAEKTVRKWVLNREIPYYKIKKIIRFRLSEIEKLVEENKIKIKPKKSGETLEAEFPDLTEKQDAGTTGCGAEA